MLQLGQHLKHHDSVALLSRPPRWWWQKHLIQGGTAPGLRPLNSTISQWPERALEQGRNDAILSQRCPCKHGSDRWEAKRAECSLELQSCAGEAAGWARHSAEVNTHEGKWHYWPGLVHTLPREGLRHSRRFLWLTRPVLQQPCPSEEQQAKYLKQQ